jgi:hypothetical protein
MQLSNMQGYQSTWVSLSDLAISQINSLLFRHPRDLLLSIYGMRCLLWQGTDSAPSVLLWRGTHQSGAE